MFTKFEWEVVKDHIEGFKVAYALLFLCFGFILFLTNQPVKKYSAVTGTVVGIHALSSSRSPKIRLVVELGSGEQVLVSIARIATDYRKGERIKLQKRENYFNFGTTYTYLNYESK